MIKLINALSLNTNTNWIFFLDGTVTFFANVKQNELKSKVLMIMSRNKTVWNVWSHLNHNL